MHADRDAIHLWFHDVFDGIPVELLANRFIEVEEPGQCVFVLKAVTFCAVRLLLAVRVICRIDLFEREHWLEMLDAGKGVHRGTSNPLGRGIWSDPFRVCLFEAG